MTNSIVVAEEHYGRLVMLLLQQSDVIQDGKSFGSKALKVKGKIFTMLVKDVLVVKLPKERIDALIALGIGERFDPRHNGSLMKEWFCIAPAFVSEWQVLACEALEFVGSKR